MSNATAEIVRVTPEIAKQWLKEKMYPRHRPLRDDHVFFLANEMRNDEFLDCHTTINVMMCQGKSNIINGQHRLNAVVESKIPTYFTVTKSVVSSMEEIDKAYGKLDIQGIRTFYDTVIAMGFDGFHVTTKQHINATYSALKLIYKGFMNDVIRDSNYILYKKTREWSIYAKQYFDLLEGLKSSHASKMRISNILAVALSAIRFSNNHLNGDKSALAFWQHVASGEMLKRTDPRMVLHRIIIESQVKSSIYRKSNISPKLLGAKAAVAWNAYIKDRETTFIRPPKSIKVPLSFTPFNYSMTIAQYRRCFEESDWGDDWPSA